MNIFNLPELRLDLVRHHFLFGVGCFGMVDIDGMIDLFIDCVGLLPWLRCCELIDVYSIQHHLILHTIFYFLFLQYLISSLLPFLIKWGFLIWFDLALLLSFTLLYHFLSDEGLMEWGFCGRWLKTWRIGLSHIFTAESAGGVLG